jgi:DNA-binding NarL/FixJ family response regulator
MAVTTVGVLAQDPVTLVGLTEAMRGQPGIELASCEPDRVPEVVVVAGDGTDPSLTRTVAAVRSRAGRVVAVVGELDSSALLAVVDAGAAVVLPRREATDARLAEAVRSAAAGTGALPAEWLRRLVAGGGAVPADGADASEPVPPTPDRSLSERELLVLRLLADGFSTAEIAAELAYSESTIKLAIHELTTRLQLRNRSHAVAFALRAGLI